MNLTRTPISGGSYEPVRRPEGGPIWVAKASGGVRATLDMDFDHGRYWFNGKTYTPHSDFLTAIGGTFARTSAATYFDSDGILQTAASGELRFDHDPSDNSALGVLLEGARTNLQVRSEEFDNAAWTKQNGTIAGDDVAAPDGTTTADKFTDSATDATHGFYDDIVLAGATTGAFSVYAKAGTHNYVVLSYTGSAENCIGAVFDLSDGTAGETDVGTTSGTIVSTSIVDVGGGWYRCVLVGSMAPANGSFIVGLAEAKTGNTWNASSQPTYAGTGKTVHFWGAQVELGSFPSSYIKTTTTAVTRAADSYIIGPTGGVPFTGWNASEGTFVAQGTSKYNTTGRILHANQNNGNTQGLSAGKTTSSRGVATIRDDDGTNHVNIASTTNFNYGLFNKYYIGYKTGDMDVGWNGASRGTSVGTLDIALDDRLHIGSSTQSGLEWFGTISRLTYFDALISSADRLALST